MTLAMCLRGCAVLSLTVSGIVLSGAAQTAQYPNYPSETPAHYTAPTAMLDYERRDVMIPMRDGVKLHTVILLPKSLVEAHGAKHAGILLTRTPYDATGLTSHADSTHLGPILEGYDNAADVIVEDGYIRVVQDVRGKYGSEGDFVMNRPVHGAQNPTPVDEATDTYDSIDWLVKNVPESNGKVGILGISYNGFLPLMALYHPHPALKVAVPMNPMVDGWMGDDWFHNGAFREQNMPYVLVQEATRGNNMMAKWFTGDFDDFETYMKAGSAGELGKEQGLEQVGFWKKILAHPSYDAFWSDQAVDKVLAQYYEHAPMIPTMLVASLWDQEDIYGAIAVYKAIKPLDKNGDLHLVIGPWHHGQEIGDGSSLGAIHFNSDTGLFFRQHILRPFLAKYLMDDPLPTQIPSVWAFRTGTNEWERLASWPSGCDNGCTVEPSPLYLTAGLGLSFTEPAGSGAEFDAYVSDPAKPVPYRRRPAQPIGYDPPLTWPQWLVDDQREQSGRTDVLTYTSEVLKSPVQISGQPVAHLVASTSGTDSDWVVKLIDVYPDEVADQPELGGYELMIAADIFRGRYRESLAVPHAIPSDEPLEYKFNLPTANHVFLPGHRIMVQVQSSWFPLYDRNPQTFVPNIFWAKPGDYQKAEQKVWHAPGHESYVELPVVHP
ncbi:MAG: CocE/NonD family hydrolase [Acidobacteriaceae bacterium]